jgi:hypothetical protein
MGEVLLIVEDQRDKETKVYTVRNHLEDYDPDLVMTPQEKDQSGNKLGGEKVIIVHDT